MKIKVSQKELNKCINIVQKAITSKTTLPILNGILLEAENDVLKLTGTDLEIGIESKINCEVIEEGSIVIASRLFGDIIRKLPDLEVEIVTDEDNNVHITCGNSKFNIIGQPSVEYPQLPVVNDDISLNIPKDLLKSMIKQTIFAAAQDEIKPILTGALLEVNNKKATLVALDGYRLAVKEISVNSDNNIKVVIPSKTLNEVSRILDDDDSDVIIMFTSSHVLFDFGETVIISRLLEGEFINYRDIIRNEYKSRVKVNTKSIQESIERASLLAREGKNNLVKFTISDEKMTISSNSEIGNVYEELPIDLEGNDIKIAFNSKYMLDALRVIDNEEIIMDFESNVKPCIMRPYEDNSYTYLVLPVRLNENY
ncbi:DNA polymerase III, beta subunit [Caloranaerobacter azorensis DSM 13643]|uniref:Beta sliding clamp n=1 Tax=Caloranaerobacter azorensis DSM 13643 TaxID=1121264 RepID=A0A1M5VT46_9FIRM|nr:DNA polymerase III subunit beta [Caloranaerobacter azorensis]SHH78164.1 DNA polymerase III, beta subunit [Caloranaerobacter azorensis DSM 13643]